MLQIWDRPMHTESDMFDISDRHLHFLSVITQKPLNHRHVHVRLSCTELQETTKFPNNHKSQGWSIALWDLFRIFVPLIH